jgi:hypothetical protein
MGPEKVRCPNCGEERKTQYLGAHMAYTPDSPMPKDEPPLPHPECDCNSFNVQCLSCRRWEEQLFNHGVKMCCFERMKKTDQCSGTESTARHGEEGAQPGSASNAPPYCVHWARGEGNNDSGERPGHDEVICPLEWAAWIRNLQEPQWICELARMQHQYQPDNHAGENASEKLRDDEHAKLKIVNEKLVSEMAATQKLNHYLIAINCRLLKVTAPTPLLRQYPALARRLNTLAGYHRVSRNNARC